MVRAEVRSLPRSSPFQIVLSGPEEGELRRRAEKYTLPYFQVVRAKMILLAAEGHSNDVIAARLGTRREVGDGRWCQTLRQGNQI